MAEYIDSLKEDGELDKLIQDILRAYGITIFVAPEKGRQFGVDIYAIGKDFEDNGREKVFLITVKQGDFDRNTWHGNQNALQPSLEDIRTVFIRSNLAAQHKHLPIKIVVAFNGLLKQQMQQNWRGYTESHPEFDYALWNSGWLLTQFEAKLLSEDAFSTDTRSLLRKTIIHLENPDYQLADFTDLLNKVIEQFKKAKIKKAKLKVLRELHVTVSIILKYAEQADNLMHSIRVSEKYLLTLWPVLNPGEPDKDFTLAFVAAHDTLMRTYLAYYHKIGFVGFIRDGYSRRAHDPVIYTYTMYEQIGIISMTGLILLQMCDLVEQVNVATFRQNLENKAKEVAATLISTFNNNPIIYSPRADEQHIEICLALTLLQKLGMHEQIRSLLYMFNNQIGEGFMFLHIFPEFTNSRRKIAELEVDYEKRIKYDYQASNLFTVLAEWAAITNDEKCYRLYFEMKERLLKEMDLLLWFPEKETEDMLFTKNATSESGYALSNIVLPESLVEMRTIIKREYENNCSEKEFSFIKQGIWSIGLLASRHYKTYIFPHYWRQFLTEDDI